MPSNIFEFFALFLFLALLAGMYDYLMANSHRVGAALRGQRIPPPGRTYAGRYQQRRRKVRQIRARMRSGSW